MIKKFFQWLFKTHKENTPMKKEEKSDYEEVKKLQKSLAIEQAEHQSLKNKIRAEKEAAEKQAELDKWIEAQPKYVVVAKKNNGGILQTDTIKASGYVDVVLSNEYLYHYRGDNTRPAKYDTKVKKTGAKRAAEMFIENSISTGTVVIGDVHTLIHAIVSFEIVEVEE